MIETTSTGMTCSEEETNAEIASPSSPEANATAQQHTASSNPGLPSSTASDGCSFSARAIPIMIAVCTVTISASAIALDTI